MTRNVTKAATAAARGFAQARSAIGEVDLIAPRIPADMTFRQWCESLTQERTDPITGQKRPALKVDGRPFRLDDRPAMAWIYDQVPGTPKKARRMTLTVMKCAQVGFTIMEMLMAIYFAFKWEPLKVGMFLPDASLARGKSAERFLPIVRMIPEAYERMTADEAGGGEGNIMIRRMGGSLFHFLWTSGRATTESYPMDVVTFDEVQEMDVAHMEKVRERFSASPMKFTLMGSTANWPDADIHHWYKQGTQHRFHTLCPTCGTARPLDDYFPRCIRFDPNQPDPFTGQLGDYRYVCPEGHWIDDPQQGEWRAENPEAAAHRNISIHFHQMLSPTITPREMIEAYNAADDLKNFFNRKLGKPYQDPSQLPVSLEHLNACAAKGVQAGLVWKTRARGTFMGIDQMGAHNVVVIKERLPDGHQAVVHVEEIYDSDPFARCDTLMKDYGVQVCVVESLPNFNDAHRFANRHRGKVFLGSYGDLEGDAIRWGDRLRLDSSSRRTAEEERSRYIVKMDQYKCMSMSLARLSEAKCLFPDPTGLTQEVVDKGGRRHVAVLKDRAFVHFQRTALVTDTTSKGERKPRRRVLKVGIDPHFSFANLLCDVAYARAYGSATFIVPAPEEERAGAAPSNAKSLEEQLPGIAASARGLLEELHAAQSASRCRDCDAYPVGSDGPPPSGICAQTGSKASAKDYHCKLFVSAGTSLTI